MAFFSIPSTADEAMRKAICKTRRGSAEARRRAAERPRSERRRSWPHSAICAVGSPDPAQPWLAAVAASAAPVGALRARPPFVSPKLCLRPNLLLLMGDFANRLHVPDSAS
jgi:hypothetical protein